MKSTGRRPFVSDAFIELDVHGMNTYQARAAIDAALRRAGGAYRIRVIHGYTRGTQLRDMIYDTYDRHPLVLRLTMGLNPGQTDLILREL